MAYSSLPSQLGDIKKSVRLNYGCLHLAARTAQLTQPAGGWSSSREWNRREKNQELAFLAFKQGSSSLFLHICKVHVTRGTTASSLGVTLI